jgi:hypothetical protein
LLPVRVKRYRFRPFQVLDGWQHKLSKEVFANPSACAEDWAAITTGIYRDEKRLVVAEEKALIALRDANLVDQPRPLDFPPVCVSSRMRVTNKGERPSKEHVFHKATQQWVKIPPACCVADDHQVRAGYVLQGYWKFAYDKATQRVLPVG